MRGVSNIIVLILLLMIAVSLTLSFYLFSTGTVFKIFPAEAQQKEYLRSRACLNIERIVIDETVIIKNCGLTPLKDFKLLVNGQEIQATVPQKLEPQQEGVVTNFFMPTGSLDVFVIADFAESPTITVTK